MDYGNRGPPVFTKWIKTSFGTNLHNIRGPPAGGYYI